MVWNNLQKFFEAHGLDRTYWIAYSGGLDSHVLLHLCAQLREFLPLKITAIHVNHQLSPHASSWAVHTERVCRELQVSYILRTIQLLPQRGVSPEALAREKRYQVFADCLGDGDMLLTAHQQDDQAETVLLQLLRGAGPKGLSAMPVVKLFSPGWHGRPLLDFTREVLQHYAENVQLEWIDDESNLDLAFSRNFLRHEVVPLLRQQWPAITQALARVATNCAETQALLEQIGKEDLASVASSHAACHSELSPTLSVQRLLQLDPARQRLALRTWLQQLGYPSPPSLKMQTLQRDILLAHWDSVPCLKWGKVELRRYRDELHVMSVIVPLDSQARYMWDGNQPLTLPGIGYLITEKNKGQGIRRDAMMSVQFRQGGERVYVRGHHHSLKKLWQEWNVPSWLRSRLPLIYMKDELVAIPGFFMRQDYMARDEETGLAIKLVFDDIPSDVAGSSSRGTTT